MNATNVTLLVLYALGMSVGQVLFKLAAERSKGHADSGFLGAVFGDGYFLLALVIYGGLTILWVWLLTRLPLSRAYPFAVLAFVFTPALAWIYLGEQLNLWYCFGVALILSGLAVLVWKAS